MSNRTIELLKSLPIPKKDKARLLQCVFCKRNSITCGCDETDENKNGLCQKYQGEILFEPPESEEK